MNGAPSSNADKAAFRRSAGKCAGPIPAENRTSCGKSIRPQINDTVEAYFLHEVQFSAAIEAAHFPAAFGMLLSQHPKEGAPFLGTALAE